MTDKYHQHSLSFKACVELFFMYNNLKDRIDLFENKKVAGS